MTDRRETSNMDPALWRGLTQSRVSRRQFLRTAGVGAGALGLGGILAACGTKGTVSTNPAEKPNAGLGTSSWWQKQTLNKTLNFANWPYYIDVTHGTHPTLDTFTKQTGIKVNYTEPIDDNTTFFAKIRPELQAGQSTGYDIIVLTNSAAALGEMIDFGWLIPIDHSMMTNFDKYASKLVTSPGWDPGNKYTMAWQSGFTTIGYNEKYIKQPPTSIADLWNPAYKGKIGMMGIPEEIGAFGLLSVGVDPATSTAADWTKAAANLEKQKPLVRSYYDQNYIRALKNEDIWISMVWSGDVFQAANYQGYPQLKIAIPQEGLMFWTDNMCIPIRAENPLDAMTYMDSVYDPHTQALIEDYNAYVCPVPDAQQIILNEIQDPTIANSPTVFPDSHIQSISKNYYQWKNSQELTTWNNAFVPIFQG
ncbi:MAG: spermidine/putrescine ABC transporter substrate-binding protein [Actinomycetota bacterium]|nr:spermidine/putrescine ABC transporter substrate-binding protein [Actinomycetota bacterium]